MEISTEFWALLTSAASLAIGIIGYFLKRTITKTDEHDKDIQHIKQTYVTKTEMSDLRQEIKDEIREMKSDVKEIKENCLTKQDFYRAVGDLSKAYDRLLALHLEEKQKGV